MVVLPINENDLGRRLAQRLRSEQASESGADNDDFGSDGSPASADP
jgi:hypothetical protein